MALSMGAATQWFEPSPPLMPSRRQTLFGAALAMLGGRHLIEP